MPLLNGYSVTDTITTKFHFVSEGPYYIYGYRSHTRAGYSFHELSDNTYEYADSNPL